MTRTMGPLRKLALLGVIAACATLGATVAAAASSVLPAGPSNRQYRTTCVKPKLKPRTRQKRNRSANAKAVAPRSRPCKRPGGSGGGTTTSPSTTTHFLTTTPPTTTSPPPTTTTSPPPTTTTPPPPPPPPPPPTGCDFYASPSGDDSNPGTAAAPFRNVARLDAALSADKRGCLTTGDYGSSTSRLDLTKGGTVGHPATITAANGASPVIHGYFEIHASNLTLSNIKWDLNLIQGRTQHTGCSTTAAEGVDIEASNVTFTHNEVTAQNAPLAQRDNGIGVAWNTTVTGVVITYNKIHDFGSCNQFDHGIYYDHASNGTIANNWIWNGPCSYGTGGGDHTRGCGAGIQLYSDPSNNQVFNNVIDGTGVGCFCDGSGNNIYHNVFTNLRGVFYDNGGFEPGYVFQTYGGNNFHDNLSNADPQYVDAANQNYAVKPSSPAASWGLWTG